MNRSILAGLAFLSIFGEWELAGWPSDSFSAGVLFTCGVLCLADGYRRWRDKC